MSGDSLKNSTDAEAAFYSAFEAADTDAMMAVWAKDESDDLVCIHPHGPRLVGYAQIRASWEQILTHSPPMHLKLSGRHVVATDSLAIHCVHEHIRVGDEDGAQFTVMATNVYRRTQSGWRMILHHASTASAAGVEPNEGSERQPAKNVTVH